MSAAAVNPQQVVQYQNFRAGPSLNAFFARFINISQRPVDILWINYNGAPVRYATLNNRADWIDINTFVGHYWLFRDGSNGLPLVCLPSKTHVFLPEAPDDRRNITRKVVPVVTPVFSLKLRCMETLTGIYDDEVKIDRLPVPRSLKEDLKNLLEEFQSYRQQRVAMTLYNNNNDEENPPPQ